MGAVENVSKMLRDPFNRSEMPTRDVRAEVYAKNVQATEHEVKTFLHCRRKLTQEFDASTFVRKAIVPPPGGVGAGVYFKEHIMGFATSTAIFWRIVAPRTLGGSSNSLVYITSSNQAARGPEALVSYENQTPAVFRVWDWSTDPQHDGSRFVISLPFDDWGSYRIEMNIDGQIHDTLYIANRTVGDGMSWTNEVFLFNRDEQTFDLVWSHAFEWQPNPETKFFGWGPIIEPFPPYNFGTTNKVGFAGAALVSDLVDEVLTPSNSRIVNRNLGFEVSFLEPNHTMIAS
ncbi:MAG TPA: hypothetical protein VNA69_13975 [Thermoanaerobaculia bacterium]|nr:hypothetical protein [Thermoanaerobaculia bacterium]